MAEIAVTPPTTSAATKKKKRKLRTIIICAIVLALLVGCFFGYKAMFKGKETVTANTATVERGTISTTIEGTGTIAAIDQYTVSALVSGEVLSDYFEEGDQVEEGDLLYVLDSTDLDFSIRRAVSSLESAEISRDETARNLEYMSVTTPISGIITALNVKVGDTVQNGALVAEIVNSDQMLLTVDFNAADAVHIFAGDTAHVVPVNAPSQTVSGTVKRVATGSNTNADGVAVRPVEILVDNPGGILADSTATATVGAYACNAAGTFAYSDSASIKTQAAGDVSVLTYKKGDRVAAGSQLLQLTSETMQNSVKKSELSVKDAELSLENSREKLENYRITAPITGKVIQKTVKAGDKLDNSSAASSMAIIADLSTLTFEMSVDELDVGKIKEGQTVQVTADAAENQTFIGYVDNISIVGTSTNGVTSYPVKIVIDGDQSEYLIPGMNVSATIVIESRENVLRIPASAIGRGNVVTVKDGGSENTTSNTTDKNADSTHPMADGDTPKKSSDAILARMGDAPAGYHYVIVETGLTDGNYIEITAGLTEGDIVLLPDITTTDAATEMRAMMGGMMGGGGGGMPPSGGMAGGGANRNGATAGGNANRSGAAAGGGMR